MDWLTAKMEALRYPETSETVYQVTRRDNTEKFEFSAIQMWKPHVAVPVFQKPHMLRTQLVICSSFLVSFNIATVGCPVSSESLWCGNFKGIVTNASSGNGVLRRARRDLLAGFCLVVDLKCGFVETVAYPLGSALYISFVIHYSLGVLYFVFLYHHHAVSTTAACIDVCSVA